MVTLASDKRHGLPLISVVVPTQGKSAQLELCLQALRTQSFESGSFEVILVGDGVDSRSQSSLRRTAEDLGCRSLFQTRRGPAAARNLGAQHARGRLLAFTDDDCIADWNWLSCLWEFGQSHPGSGIGGSIENAYPDNVYSEVSELLLNRLRL